jgi:cell volume regulation protein A
VQGWSVRPLAKKLGLALPRTRPAVHRVDIDLPGQLEHEMVGYLIEEGSAVVARRAAPGWVRPVFVVRDDRIVDAEAAGALQAGDYGYFLVPPERVRELDRLFAPAAATGHQPPTSFPLRADISLADLDDAYGLGIPPSERGRTIAEHFEIEFEDEPSPGDRLRIGPASLVVRTTADGRPTEVGFELQPQDSDSSDDTAPGLGGRIRRLARSVTGH